MTGDVRSGIVPGPALIFPLAAAINFFSVTGLMIVCGLTGKLDLAAEIAVIQGAVLAVFLSLSANARNIILADTARVDSERNIFYFRLFAMIPASLLVYYLANNTIEPPVYLLYALIVRKCAEWMAEIRLAVGERNNEQAPAIRYILANLVSFLIVLVALLIPSLGFLFYGFLSLWAIVPAILCPPDLRRIRTGKPDGPGVWSLMPHMGSTVAVGVSTYVVRVLLVILAGKTLAGQLLSAYALGGILSALYVYAFGPSLMLVDKARRHLYLTASVASCFFLGAATIALPLVWGFELYSPWFLVAIGVSFWGGGIMILAQSLRLYILQKRNREVFVPDAAANILVISSIPFAFYVFGDVSFVFLFLWSAMLHLLFYFPLSWKAVSETA